MTKNNLNEQIAYYEQLYEPETKLASKPAATAKPRESRSQVQYGEPDLNIATEEGFVTTYKPARYEKGFLLQSLYSLYEQALLYDILAKVRGGKEASVYRCRAYPATGYDLLAAKVYRPRMFRSLRNDAMYREGREMIETSGSTIKANDAREMRALRGKTRFGQALAQGSWLGYEYLALRLLHQAGADVPAPLGANDHAILMTYYGDEHLSAPTLMEVELSGHEARVTWELVLHNIHLFLKAGYIHGDLSAYNILYWKGQIAIIDLPQVTHLVTNRNAYHILARDIQRTVEYFNQYDLGLDGEAISVDLWAQYMATNPLQAGDDFQDGLIKG